jgi:hypothetical protein
MPVNPLTNHGSLNRVRGSIIVPLFPILNITSPYMGKNLLSVNFEGNFDEQVETATGVVTSPEPYVMATVTADLLRTQGLATAWLAQGQLISDIGPITVFSDSSSFEPIVITNTVIRSVEPGVFDGMNPIVKLTLRGVFIVNALLWASA